MILSKLQVGMIVAIVCAIGLGLGWQIRTNSKLREAARQSAAALPSVAALDRQVAAESQRSAAAEARVAALLKTAKLSTPVREAPLGPISTEDAVNAAMERAKQLIADGKRQEALEEYVKSYRELQAIRPGSTECQRLMSAIGLLGRRYPEAHSALGELRDSAMAQLQAQPGRRGLAFEIALLNERLGEGNRTLALYDSLPAKDPDRQEIAPVAIRSFIEARRYNDALIGRIFGIMLAGNEYALQQTETMEPERRESIISGTLTNIEVLTGVGRFDEARKLTEKLLAFDNSDATRASLQQHVNRAQAPQH